MHISISKQTDDLPYALEAWAPNTSEAVPVVVFMSGFLTTGCGMYSEMLSAIAAHGYAVIGIDRGDTIFEHPDWARGAKRMAQVLAWVEAHGATVLRAHGSVLDVEKLAVMGHSEGARLMVEMLQLVGCGPAKALLLISPLDGGNPYKPDPATEVLPPGSQVQFAIPTLQINGELENQPVNRFEPACAPAAMTGMHFYEALQASSPIWFLNATGFGHLDYLDKPIPLTGAICKTNKDPEARAKFRGLASGASVAFLRAVFVGPPGATLADLEDTARLPVPVSDIRHSAHGWPYASCSHGHASVLV